MVPKVYSGDSKGFANNSHGFRGYIYVMATLKFTYFEIKRCFLNYNHETSLIGDVFISYDR